MSEIHKQNGLTRIEALTVVAGTLFVCVILGPVIARSREVSKDQQCRYQLMTLGRLCMLYSDINGGQLPEPAGGFGESGAYYYTYRQAVYYDDPGPLGLGYLWKHHLIESASDLPYCPGPITLFGVPGELNPDGDSSHSNYCGGYMLAFEDEHIGWLPLRLSYGVRKTSILTDDINNIVTVHRNFHKKLELSK